MTPIIGSAYELRYAARPLARTDELRKQLLELENPRRDLGVDDSSIGSNIGQASGIDRQTGNTLGMVNSNLFPSAD